MNNTSTPSLPKTKKLKRKGNAKETLYRVTLQNQLRSIGIVDQKANIIIGINTILISIIIATIGIETSFVDLNFFGNIGLSLPFTIMLLFCFSSGIVAIFVVRPTAFLWIKENPSRLFFKDYRNIKLEQFKAEMKEMLRSDEEIYEALDVDIYLYGLTVQRKFRLVRLAYLIFMIGFILTVALFFILRIWQYEGL
jgi:hypothetical protein